MAELSSYEKFLIDLTELSRKHRVWIRGRPEQQPQLFPGYGDETGYEPLLRFRGQRSADVHFRLLSASLDWGQGDPETRGPAPEPIQKIFDDMYEKP